MQFQPPPTFAFGAATPPRSIHTARPSLKRGNATFLDTNVSNAAIQDDEDQGGLKKRRISPTSAFSKLRISPPRAPNGMFLVGDAGMLPFASNTAAPSFFTTPVVPQESVHAIPIEAYQAPDATPIMADSKFSPAPEAKMHMHTGYKAYEISPDRIYVESLSSSPSSTGTPIDEVPPTNPHFQTLNLHPQVAAHLQKTFDNPWVPRDYCLAQAPRQEQETSVVRYGVHMPWTGARSAKDEAEAYEKAWRDYMTSREAIESAAGEEPERFVELQAGAGEADGMDLDD